jgi:hypothetical protein
LRRGQCSSRGRRGWSSERSGGKAEPWREQGYARWGVVTWIHDNQ